MGIVDDLLDVLDDLKSNECLDMEQHLPDFSNRLNAIYEQPDFRHSYFELSRYLETLIPEQRDLVCGNIDLILKYSDENCNKAIVQKIAKLADHIKLENIRLARMDTIKYIGEKATGQSKSTEKKIARAGNDVKNLKKDVKAFHSQSITILGIFSGLVFTFSAAVSFLSGTFSNINNMNCFRMVLYLLIVGLIFFNVVFMLMYAIAKISDHSIAVLCRGRECTDCPHGHWLPVRLGRKYPYVLVFNIVDIILIGVFLRICIA